MARSSDINQRIRLEGSEEVRRQLEQIAQAGERSGNLTQRAFTAASKPLSGFTAGTRGATASSGQLRFALQNLSFQVNDVATSLASGSDVMRVFAQQGGQIFQAFQQGGGLSTVLGGVATKLREMITPMRALAGVGAAAAAGAAVLGTRAVSADNAIRQFKVTLDALRPPAFARGGDVLKGFGVSPEQLEEAAKRLRSAGLSLAEGRAAILDAIRLGIDPKLSEQVVRFGKDLDVALGEKGARSGEAFQKAIAGGKDELRKFGVSIGAINPNISELQDGLRDIPSLLRKIMEAPNIRGAATNVLDPLSKQARDINVEFQNILDKMSLFFKEGFVNLVGTGEAALNLLKALGTVVSQTISSTFAAAWADTAAVVQPAIDDAKAAWADFSVWFTDTLTPALSSVWGGFTSAAQSAIDTVRGWLQSLADSIRSVVGRLGSIGSEVVPGIVAQPFAAGGQVRGPGTGTSDSILARLSNGEFVMNALATRMNLPILQAMNAMNRPIMPRTRMPRGFAMGGLVAAGGGGRSATINLSLGGETFSLAAEDAVFDALTNKARRAALLSAGRKPSHTGGRRYGG